MTSGRGSFYFGEDFQRTWKRFLEIAKREGHSASEILTAFVRQYVDLHDPGNPQARITSYAEDGPIDLATIEGRIRERLRNLPECRRADILRLCRENIADSKTAMAMAERVSKWLSSRGMKVWR